MKLLTRFSTPHWLHHLLYTGKPNTSESNRFRDAANNLILHLHPHSVPAAALRIRYTWGLGGISTVLVLILVLTGLLLMFRYDARVDFAYISIQKLETEVMFGSLVRALHHWSANFLVVSTFLHLLRVFFTGSYKQGRGLNWVVGIVLFVLALAANFTGYLLPWDQLAYWAITVSTSLIAYIPLMGNIIRSLMLGGPQVGQAALSNFYALHVVVIPILLAMLMSYHFWKVRKNGGISQPIKANTEKGERLSTIPHLVNVELAAGLLVLTAVTIWSMRIAAPLGPIANPVSSPNPAKAAWYFLGLQELLLHMHPLSALVLVALVCAALVILPFIDRDDKDIGVYFRSRNGRRMAVLGALLGLSLTPLLVVLDAYWIDLPAWLPTWPTSLTIGVLPLAATICGSGLVYAALRAVTLQKDEKANHSEALVGLFSFMVTGLIILTIIGIFFRGPNMALVLPFS